MSLCASAGAYALIATAVQTRTLGLLIAACFLAGLAEANIVIAQSAVADIAPPQQRSRLFGYVYLSSSLAYVAGPLAGGRFADKSIVSWFDYATPVLGGDRPVGCRPGAHGDRIPQTSTNRSTEPVSVTAAFKSLANAFLPGRLRPFFVANFALYLAIFGFFRVYPMYLINRFHMSVARESLFVGWVAVPIVVANLGIVAWLSRRLTPRQTAARGAAVLAVLMASIVIPTAEAALWITLGLTALLVTIFLPAAAAIISDAVRPTGRARRWGQTSRSRSVPRPRLAWSVGCWRRWPPPCRWPSWPDCRSWRRAGSQPLPSWVNAPRDYLTS